jgi:hypothetical protein
MDIIKAAENLVKKGKITNEEFNLIKDAAYPLGGYAAKQSKPMLGKLLESIAPKISIRAKQTTPVMGSAMKSALPWIQGGFYATLGTSILKQLLAPISEKMKTTSSFNLLMDKNPVLEGKDPQQIKDYFNVIETFSPKAASNPLVAGALVNKMMEFGGIDHKLVQDLASIQSGLKTSDIMDQISGIAAKSLVSMPTPTSEVTTELGIGG